MHVIAGKAVCFKEAMSDSFKTYQQNIISNAKALEKALLDDGFELVSGGTDTHLMLLDLRKTGVTGKEAQIKLDTVNITVNKNSIPNEPLSPFITSGIRVGVPAVTTRGMTQSDMPEIADLLKIGITETETRRDEIKDRVAALCDKYPLY